MTKKENMKDGLVEEFYDNGQLKSRENYKDGEREGLWEEFYENGQTQSIGVYERGQKVGEWWYHDEDCEIIKSEKFDKGLLRMTWTQEGQNKKLIYFHDNGQIGSISYLKGSEPVGTWEEFNEQGELTRSDSWEEKPNQGNLKTNDLLDVNVVKEDRFVEQKGQYKDDGEKLTKEGLWEYFHKNGQLKEVGHFVNDLRDGPWKYFRENGQIEERGKYKEGKRHGINISYYENGQVEIMTTYDNDVNHGQYRRFYENGQFRSKGNVKNDKQDGLWEYFDKDGNLTETKEYKDGELVE